MSNHTILLPETLQWSPESLGLKSRLPKMTHRIDQKDKRQPAHNVGLLLHIPILVGQGVHTKILPAQRQPQRLLLGDSWDNFSLMTLTQAAPSDNGHLQARLWHKEQQQGQGQRLQAPQQLRWVRR